MDPHWDSGHPATYLIAMVTGLPWQPERNLNNSFVLGHIEFILLLSVPETIGIDHIPCCYGNAVVMATKVKPQLLLCLELYSVHTCYGGSLG